MPVNVLIIIQIISFTGHGIHHRRRSASRPNWLHQFTHKAGEDSTSQIAGARAGLVRELMTSVGMKGGTSSRPNKTVQIEYPEK